MSVWTMWSSLTRTTFRGCWTSTWRISMPGDPIRGWANGRRAGGRHLPDPPRRAGSSDGRCSAGCITCISTQRDGVLAPYNRRYEVRQEYPEAGSGPCASDEQGARMRNAPDAMTEAELRRCGRLLFTVL